MSQPNLIIERESGIVRLRLNRPEVLNALNVDLAIQLRDACAALTDDPQARVVVLSGSGRAFMAGGDLHALRQAPVSAANALIEPMHEAIRLMSELPMPVIASVHGVAAGAGLSLLMAADLVIAANNTRFNFAYTDIGTSCDGGASWALPRQVGLRRALDIALINDLFTAQEALEWGLLTRIVEPEALNTTVDQIATRLAQREPAALAHLKHLMRSASQHSLAEQLSAERTAFLDCASRPGFVTAIDQFFTKRR